MYIYVLLAFVASAAANVYVNEPCPDVKTVENFDFDAFSQGKWYEAFKYPNTLENNGKCGYAEYTREGDSTKIINYDFLDGKLRSIEGSFKALSGATGKLLFTYPYGSGKGLSQHVLNILSTDNKNYVLGYYCKYDETKGTRQDFSWLLTRSKTLSAEEEKAFEDFVASTNVLDKSKYIKNDFSLEECKNV